MNADYSVEPLISGVVGGVISTSSLYPLELVKTRMQVMGGQNATYSSFSRAVLSVFKQEGFRGFFQGLSPAVFASAGSWGGYLYFYEASKNRKLKSYQKEHGHDAVLGTKDHLLSGFEAGVILVFIFNPFWVIKTRLALQGAENSKLQKYSGLGDALRTIFREEGVRGLYKGLVPALFLTSHGAVQFATYEKLKKIAASLRPEAERDIQPAYVAGITAAASKIVASVLTYPYQVVKSRLQQREHDLNEKRYRGTIDCITQIMKKEGGRGFFRGLFPNVVKVVPQSALTLLVYEECMKLFRSSQSIKL